MTCFVQGAFPRQNSLDRSAIPLSVSRYPHKTLSKLYAWRCTLKQPDVSKTINERLLRAYFNNVNEYHSLIRYGNLEGLPMELINGRIVYMLSQSGRHSNVRSALLEILMQRLDRSAQVRSESPITLRADSNPSEPIPDICIVKRTKYGEDHPDPSNVFLVVEVVKTSTTKDKQERLSLYAEAGIPEYWIVDVSDNNAQNWNVQIYKDLKESHYRYVELFDDGSVSPSAFPNCVVNLKELFDI